MSSTVCADDWLMKVWIESSDGQSRNNSCLVVGVEAKQLSNESIALGEMFLMMLLKLS